MRETLLMLNLVLWYRAEGNLNSLPPQVRAAQLAALLPRFWQKTEEGDCVKWLVYVPEQNKIEREALARIRKTIIITADRVR